MKPQKVYEFESTMHGRTRIDSVVSTSKKDARAKIGRQLAQATKIRFIRFYPLLDIEWTRVNSDVYGNPRYVCHWTTIPGAANYEEALKKCRAIGGRKFHNKQYGGGIVVQSYNIQGETIRISGM